MKLIALGSNLDHPKFGPPKATCEAAMVAIGDAGVKLVKRSRWYRSEPVPPSDQPWFINGVICVECELSPGDLLALLHRIEAEFGRERRTRNQARVLDLDLIAYDDRMSAPGETPVLPHPRMAERAFVLRPLADIAPDWRHPASGRTLADLLRDLPSEGGIEPLD